MLPLIAIIALLSGSDYASRVVYPCSSIDGALGLVQNKSEDSEGNVTTMPLSFAVILRKQINSRCRIEWYFAPSGKQAASLADFGIKELSGSFMVQAEAGLNREAAYVELPVAILDRKSEGRETFEIRFRQQKSRRPVLDNKGNPLLLEFSIIDDFTKKVIKAGRTSFNLEWRIKWLPNPI